MAICYIGGMKKDRYEIFAYKDVSTLTGGIYTTWKYVDDDFKEFVENTIS